MNFNSTAKNNTALIAGLSMTLMLLAASVIGINNNAVIAKADYTQSSSQAEACGNGEFPMNVLCQDLSSAIQGDGNAVNVIGLQTGGDVLKKVSKEVPEDRSCEKCFERYLTQEQITSLLQFYTIDSTPFSTLKQLCLFLELVAVSSIPFEDTLRGQLDTIGVDPDTSDRLIDCLIKAGVLIPTTS